MREILFRGKSDNGTWYYGSLIHVGKFCCILTEYDGSYDYPYLDAVLGVIDGKAKPVIPETIGQYTGLTDKNGKKIFEGDIIKCHIEYNVGCYPHTETVVRVVRYNDGYFTPFNRCEKDYYEVIGNIRDNPELLEEEEE